jgi:hypothetical protein
MRGGHTKNCLFCNNDDNGGVGFILRVINYIHVGWSSKIISLMLIT